MPRVKRGTNRRDYRRKTLRLAKGYFLTKSKLNRAAQEAVEKALRYGYVGRRLKKRSFRSLWIVRINAACRQSGISYSKFINGLKRAGIDLNRKILSEIAINDATGFGALVEKAKAAHAAH
ncbi:MAG: 50S ribosomal protein L20, partial [Acidobacteriaceae bacterium]|nr:50S ribosomal protein L20 [Acidobacteriaceae bacterium]